MTILAMLNIGHKEIKISGIEAFFTPSPDASPQIDAKLYAEVLLSYELEELKESLGGPDAVGAIRNEKCFEELDSRTGGRWHLLIFGNEAGEFESETFVSGTTADLAEVMCRWMQASRPGVEVHGPVIFDGPPHIASAELSALYRDAITETIAKIPDLEELAVLSLGGTPAMRVTLEREAQLAAGDLRVETLSPTTDGSGVLRFGLLRVINRDEAIRQAAQAIRELCLRGNYASAVHTAAAQQEVMRSRTLSGYLELATRVSMGEEVWAEPGISMTRAMVDLHPEISSIPTSPSWLERVGAWIELVRKFSDTGSIDRALRLYITAAEALPAVWTAELVGELPKYAGDAAGCNRAQAFVKRSHAESSVVTQSERILGCLTTHGRFCDSCPARSMADIARDGAAAAAVLPRRGTAMTRAWTYPSGKRRRGSELNQIRNKWTHPGEFRKRADLAMALDQDRAMLQQNGISIPERAGLADVLSACVEQITGNPPPTPIASIDEAIEKALDEASR